MIRYNALILFMIYIYNECLSGIQQKLQYIFTLLIIVAAVWIGIIVSIYVIINYSVKYTFLTSYLASLHPKTYTLTPKSTIYVLQFRIYGVFYNIKPRREPFWRPSWISQNAQLFLIASKLKCIFSTYTNYINHKTFH